MVWPAFTPHCRKSGWQRWPGKGRSATNSNRKNSGRPHDDDSASLIQTAENLAGQQWFNNNHFTGEILGGWKVAWSQYYGSGSPHGVGADGSPYGNGNLADRVANAPIKVNRYKAVKKWILAGADRNPTALPTVIQNNGAFVSPGKENGVSAAASEYIPGNSKTAYSEFRDPTYMVENVGLMKEFAMLENAKGILRVIISIPSTAGISATVST